MNLAWRLTNEGTVRDEHLLECLAWMGWLTPEQLARLSRLDIRRVHHGLKQLQQRGLAGANQRALWQPTAQGRRWLSRQTPLDWTRQEHLPPSAVQVPATAAVIELIRSGVAFGAVGVAVQLLVSSATREPDGYLPIMTGVSMILNPELAMRADIPWTYGPLMVGSQSRRTRLAVMELGPGVRPSLWLRERGRRYGRQEGEHWVPLWIAQSAQDRRDLIAQLLNDEPTGVWAVSDPEWLSHDRVAIADEGWITETTVTELLTQFAQD